MSEGTIAQVLERLATWSITQGDCRELMKLLPDNSIDFIGTDAPYHLTQASRKGSPRKNDSATPFGRHAIGEKGFMGRTWDGGGVAFDPATWAEALRVAKPGAHLMCFGGSRTFGRLMVAIEDAGWEIRDSLLIFCHGEGFPKGTPQLKGSGLQTALKPAVEPIVLARKPFKGTVLENIKRWGTGALNVDACRVAHAGAADLAAHVAQVEAIKARGGSMAASWKNSSDLSGASDVNSAGRWPPNLLLQHKSEFWYTLRSDATWEEEKAFYGSVGAFQAVRVLREAVHRRTFRDQETEILLDGVRVRFAPHQKKGVGEAELPSMRRDVRGDAGVVSGRSPEVLLEEVPRLVLGRPEAEEGPRSFGRVERSDEQKQSPARTREVVAVEGRHLHVAGVSDEDDRGTPGARADARAIDDESSLRLRAQTQHGDRPGKTDTARRTGPSQERGEGGQSPGESRGRPEVGAFTRSPASDEAAGDPGAGGALAAGREFQVEVEARRISAEWSARLVLVGIEGCKRLGTSDVAANPTWDTPNRNTEPSAFTGSEVSKVRHANGRYGEASAEKRYNGQGSTTFAPLPGARRDDTETVEQWECVEGCPIVDLSAQSGERTSGFMAAGTMRATRTGFSGHLPHQTAHDTIADTGSAARYFPQFGWTALDDELALVTPFRYLPKPSTSETEAGLEHFRRRSPKHQGEPPDGSGVRNPHPTKKSVELVRWLLRLGCPRGGLPLDIFNGTAPFGVAALLEGLRYLGFELHDDDAEPYVEISRARLHHVEGREFVPRESLRTADPPRQCALFSAQGDG